MSLMEDRIAALGLVLPSPVRPPPGVILPFAFVRVVGNRAYISGHGPQNADGSLAAPFGKVGRQLTVEQGYHAARLTALSVLGNLKSCTTSTAWCAGCGCSGWSIQPPDSTSSPA